MSFPYCCYILANNLNNQTYCGITNDFLHRFRAHCKLIKGGALRTSLLSEAGRWHPAVQIIGFPTKRSVLQFEYCMKRNMDTYRRNNLSLNERKRLNDMSRTCDKSTRRIEQLMQTLSLQRWTKAAEESDKIPLTIVWYTDRYRPRNFHDDFLSQHSHLSEIIHPGIIDECTVDIYNHMNQKGNRIVCKPYTS